MSLLQQGQEVLLAQLHPLLGDEGQDEGQALLRQAVLAALVAVLNLLALKDLCENTSMIGKIRNKGYEPSRSLGSDNEGFQKGTCTGH